MNINEFLDTMWIYIAPYGYENFLKQGRGLVYIDVSKFKFNPITENEVEVIGGLRYIPAKSAEIRQVMPAKLQKEVIAYNATTHICFLFVDESNDNVDPRFLRCALAKQPGPKILYESLNTKAQ